MEVGCDGGFEVALLTQVAGDGAGEGVMAAVAGRAAATGDLVVAVAVCLVEGVGIGEWVGVGDGAALGSALDGGGG